MLSLLCRSFWGERTFEENKLRASKDKRKREEKEKRESDSKR